MKQYEGISGNTDHSAYITFIPHTLGLETHMKDRQNLSLERSRRELNLTFWLVQQMSLEEKDYNYVT